MHNGQSSPPGPLVNDQSIYVTGNDYADGSNYGLSDNMISMDGSILSKLGMHEIDRRDGCIRVIEVKCRIIYPPERECPSPSAIIQQVIKALGGPACSQATQQAPSSAAYNSLWPPLHFAESAQRRTLPEQ